MDKKIKGKLYNSLIAVLLVLFASASTIIYIDYFSKYFKEDYRLSSTFIFVAVLLVELLIALYIQIIVHELGHLVCGLISGYRFSSFRIGNLMLVRSEGKFSLKRFSLAGTGGQCLMYTERTSDKVPYILYNLGGVIFNLMLAAICLIGMYGSRNLYLSFMNYSLFVVGVASAILNGIPKKFEYLNNDGYNLIDIYRSREAHRCFLLQLKINKELTDGKRLADLPDAWFEVDDSYDSVLVWTIEVFKCNKLMDELDFENAKKCIRKVLSRDIKISKIHRQILLLDLIYCELITGENDNVIIDADMDRFIRSMRKMPSVIRTMYTIALLKDRDTKEALKIREVFEETARKYPYTGEILSESKMMRLADQRAGIV